MSGGGSLDFIILEVSEDFLSVFDFVDWTLPVNFGRKNYQIYSQNFTSKKSIYIYIYTEIKQKHHLEMGLPDDPLLIISLNLNK